MKTDILDNEINSRKCLEGKTTSYIPSDQETIFDDGFFAIHQYPYVALPGFFVISSKRDINYFSEMDVLEQRALGHIIAISEKVIREVTKASYLTLVQEDNPAEGHLHILLFPWHNFLLEKYEINFANIQVIIEQYKNDMRYEQETLSVISKVRKLLKTNTNTNDFRNQNLCNTDFSNRDLSYANFQGAILKRCDFKGCNLSYANFNDADLYRASFEKANLYASTFKNADLTRADFTQAHLYGIKIFGADLTHTKFDKVVQEEKEKEFVKAEDIYNTIKRAYSENGNKENAAIYYYKQCVAKRKQKKKIYQFFNWLFADLFIGYGERLWRCLSICGVIIFVFAIVYFSAMNYKDFLLCLISSLAVFFGFDPIISNTVNNMRIFCIIEQLIGYFLIALALIGITRKIVRD